MTITTPPRTQTEPLLEIRDLSVDYGYDENAVTALSNVNLTLHRGEILGLAGESGCGKSTLAYAATRLLPPPGVITGGEVMFTSSRGGGSGDLLRMSDKQLRAQRWRDTAIVFQGSMNALNPVYRVGTQLMDGIAAHEKMPRKAMRERAAELLTMVGISADRLDSYPHQLSGGMRQRVMIAMALALEPELVIMDEPTTALDVVMQRQIVEQIIELKDELGFSVIFITHDVSLLIELADRIAIMYAGEIVEDAGSREVYHEPRHPYTAGLLHSFPPLRGPKRELGGIPGSPPDLLSLPSGCRFRTRCPYAFDACARVVPQLGDTLYGDDEAHRGVACHLHDATIDGPPVPPELAVRPEGRTLLGVDPRESGKIS
ncbi:ABC transporter ATP-binding protein [Paramicrobacterium agarici]|uniref:ABC transporter ATP-binding protein n=1 Tax=Paramicrobacterium agarici TaxID=630514 RepID=UPI00116D151B|nr:ABC transporter ATP-binding protein [Microbacterium agarici]TQO23101.1 peptide/nickel transport system ATP-binding protein [Microbacterium agarici]